MAYRTPHRAQINMFPQSIEEFVSEEDPVRAYDAFVEALDVEELGLEVNFSKIGNPSYHPKAMLKLLLYGYSYGWRSSRKLERATHHNVSFMWLLGGLKPDHKTIANFRKNNLDALKKVLKQCARMCIALGLIEGNTLFIDGSKFRGNAGRENTHRLETWKKQLEHIDRTIEELLQECEDTDKQENGSLVKLKKSLRNQQKLKDKITQLVQEMQAEGKERGNLTDKECVRIKSRQGSHVGYNAQIVTDSKHGLIVSSDVVAENNDIHQLDGQVENAHEVLGKKCQIVCADSGYSDSRALRKTVEKGIMPIVPSQKEWDPDDSKDKISNGEAFIYDAEHDRYICPKGHFLTYSYFDKIKRHKRYKIRPKSVCKSCKLFGVCTRAITGKQLSRRKEDYVQELVHALYHSSEGTAIYAKRKQCVELPFGHIKHNLKGSHFLLRGLHGVNAEMAINTACFNVARMISLLGGVLPMRKALAR